MSHANGKPLAKISLAHIVTCEMVDVSVKDCMCVCNN